MKIVLLGKYTMELVEDDCVGINNDLGSLSPYIRSVVLHTKECSIDVMCYHEVARRVGRIPTVAEYFAGVGIMTLFIQQLCKPAVHIVSDFSPQCVDHLSRTFKARPGVEVKAAGDAFTRDDLLVGDFTSIDYNMTYTKIRSDTVHRRLLDKIVAAKPKYIHMSDKSMAYFHVNKGKYAESMGISINEVADYVGGLNDYMFDEYGYGIIYYAHYRTAGHILMRSSIRSGDYSCDIEDMSEHTNCLELLGNGKHTRGVI